MSDLPFDPETLDLKLDAIAPKAIGQPYVKER